jgi:GNAT superfamily N-acetyltransferase
MVRRAESDAEVARCYDIMAELRPHITRDTFLPLVRTMAAEGYRLAFVEEGGEVVAVAGYRMSTNLFMGRHLYVEDLVTAGKKRSQGYGAQLIDWLQKEAGRQKCSFVDLDSGTHRGDAHRFYFRHGFTIACFHFAKRL